MNHLPARLLFRLNYFYALVDILAIAFGVATHLLHFNQYHWGFDTLAFVFIAIHLTYATLIYPFYQKKNNWQATVISQVLFDFIFAILINSSHQTNYYYRVGWMLTAGISSSLGAVLAIFEVAIDMSLNVFTLTGIITQSAAGPITEWLISFGVASSAFIGWLIFRHHFVRPNYYMIDELSVTLAREKSISGIILKSIADGIIVIDTNSKIRLINPAAALIAQWKVEDAQGIDIHSVIKLVLENGQPLSADADVFTLALKNKVTASHTLQLKGRNNKQTIVSVVVSPVLVQPNNKVAGAVAVIRDVTTDRREEQQRADFISTASHEMRTPVAAIEGYLALALNDRVATVDSRARSFLEKAHSSTQSLGKLFQDLLTSAKADDGRLSNHPTVLEMSKFLEDITNDLRFAAQKKGLLTDFVLGSSQVIDARTSNGKVVAPIYYAFADPDRLREVITNLFDNAVKYSEQGKITIGLTADNDNVQFYIKDTGSGIAPEDIPHLFQKFYRVDNSATRSVGGTGLGLFISKKIIELYQGRVWVESELGKGSTFFVNLPRLTTSQAEQLKASEAASGSVLSS